MRVLHTGYVKSGNSWLYTMLRLALDRAGYPDRGFWREHPCYGPLVTTMGHRGSFEGMADLDYLDVGPYTFRYELGRTDAFMPVLDLDDYVSRCRQIWTHCYASDRLAEVVRRVDRVVCIVRDPRDILVSMSHYVFAPPYLERRPQFRCGTSSPAQYVEAQLAVVMRDWCRHVYGFLRRRDTWPLHIVLYERLLSHFDEEFDRLLLHVGIELPESTKREIKERASFGSMHQSGPHHARTGTRGQWRDELTLAQQEEALTIAGPMLALLGYSTTEPAGTTIEPEIPEALDWHKWTHEPWPHPELRAFRYTSLVTLFRETFTRVARHSIPEVGGWGADVCGRAMLDAAAAEGITVRYVVDSDISLHGHTLGGARIVSPDEVGRNVPLLPMVIGSLSSIPLIRQLIEKRFRYAPQLQIFAPIPGRGRGLRASSVGGSRARPSLIERAV